jgi:hypothetical protein
LRLLRLLDAASDFVLPGSESWHDVDPGSADEANLRLDYLRAIASALGAVAFLLLRRDEEMLREWWNY